MPAQSQIDPELRRLLEERAQLLARQEEAEVAAQGEEMVHFRLGDHYALPARTVRMIQPLEQLTPLPATPAFIAGLVNVWGRLLCAIDLRPLLDQGANPPASGRRFLIIVAAGGLEIGLIADEVLGVQPAEQDLAPAMATAAGRSLPWVRGLDSALALIIDPGGLVADPRLTINAEDGLE